MQRYKSVEEVKTGDRIIYDNTSGFKTEFPKIRSVGTVIGTIDKNIQVEFRMPIKEIVTIEIPYFLAQ